MRRLSLVRILVVDRYAQFREVVRSILEGKPGLQVVGEAADGSGAVRKAEELRPDLVILDIDLCELDRLEVAQQIRRLSPRSKILCLSQHDSPVLAQQALSTGAHGYVVKWRAARELEVAVHAAVADDLTGEHRRSVS